jgi:cold-inducible RNA-binding protein
MSKKLYVGNLPYSVNDQKLGEMFAEFGEVVSAKVVTDYDSGRSKGFGFVEMANDGEAQNAISKLDGSDVAGRSLRVNEARPREERK